MDPQAIVGLLIALEDIATRAPALIANIKAALSSTDEAALQAHLAELRTSNAADYEKATAALARVAGN